MIFFSIHVLQILNINKIFEKIWISEFKKFELKKFKFSNFRQKFFFLVFLHVFRKIRFFFCFSIYFFVSRYSDQSRDTSPHPHISHPSSSANFARDDYLNDELQGFKDEEEPVAPPPAQMYMGSGPLTHENVHRGATQKRNYQATTAGQPKHGQQVGNGNFLKIWKNIFFWDSLDLEIFGTWL